MWYYAALPVTATVEADGIVCGLGSLLQDYGQQLVHPDLLEDVAPGIAHSLCAAQVIGWLDPIDNKILGKDAPLVSTFTPF